ncbi:hypothetical protein [Tropicibacter sp. Alg240-R139]|uniref:hypothetical protein n=1 Tax=Tropicibacter sp. Alg240-R139 TaxID=2305991 RepID=UPI0013E08D74|nr:hypothetical protein [Tropicibacter sp. Alg240-R139]
MPKTNREAFEEWVISQNRETQTAIATRATIRAWPCSWPTLPLIAGRSLITSLAYTRTPNKELEFVCQKLGVTNAHDWAHFPLAHDYTSYDFAIVESVNSALKLAAFASATQSEPPSALDVIQQAQNPFISWLSDTEEYHNGSFDEAFNRSLWSDEAQRYETLIRQPWLKKYNDESHLFWLDWYQGFLNGTPIDWELQRRVALIDEAIWDSGTNAVADKIRDIQGDYRRTATPPPQRFPELEPTSTTRLITNAATISPALSSLSFRIEGAQAQFHQFGYNEVPEAFAPLVELPAILARISSKLGNPAPNTDVEDALRAEVGRLNAKVVALEAALDKALRNQPATFTNTFKEHCAKSLGDWKLYGAIVSGLFLLSGDDATLKERGENLMLKREQLFGDVSPSPYSSGLSDKVARAERGSAPLPRINKRRPFAKALTLLGFLLKSSP